MRRHFLLQPVDRQGDDHLTSIAPTESRPRLQVAILAAALVLWLATLAALTFETPSGHVILRALIAALAGVLAALILRRGPGLLILSPLYLLGVIAVVFYSLTPALYKAFVGIFARTTGPSYPTIAYVGSLGEMLVLQFAAFAFALTALLLVMRPVLDPEAPSGRGWTVAGVVAVGLILALAAALSAIYQAPLLRSLISAGVGRQFADALPPIISFGLATAAYVAARSPARYGLLFVAVVSVVFVAMAMSITGLIPIFIAVSAIGLFVLRASFTWRMFALLAAIIVILTAGALFISFDKYTATVEQPRRGYADIPAVLARSVISKLMVRFGVSGECLDRIARSRMRDRDDAEPFYFITAVVPRLLWPSKPNLSRGHEYAVEFCASKINPKLPHSEATTLLGEPIIRAGTAGMVVAQALVGIVLAGVTLIAHRAGAVGVISLTAILPWLIVFEQHFALYLANATKMFLLMTPLLIGLLWCRARAS